LTGFLYAAGFYLMLQRSFIRLIIGIIVFAHASNLFVFVAGGINRSGAPFVTEDTPLPVDQVADPLPQAMILTAIVIGLGIQVFAIVLLKRVYHVVKSSDLDELNQTDQPPHG
ncbi:MAG: NADH-quinone oxidoreductase subunit K, partial [Cyclobacteriaceae bacterium]